MDLICDFVAQISVKGIWGSEVPEHRHAIRRDLFQHYGEASLLDLQEHPRLTNPYVSISHTVGLGGWISDPNPVGFDIEASERPLSERALNRLASPLEQALGPDPLSLWVAKEAAFKSLWWATQIKTLSQIEALSWKQRGADQWAFQWSVKFNDIKGLGPSGQGLILKKGRFTLGIAKPRP